jgi:hypothetical protein
MTCSSVKGSARGTIPGMAAGVGMGTPAPDPGQLTAGGRQGGRVRECCRAQREPQTPGVGIAVGMTLVAGRSNGVAVHHGAMKIGIAADNRRSAPADTSRGTGPRLLHQIRERPGAARDRCHRGLDMIVRQHVRTGPSRQGALWDPGATVARCFTHASNWSMVRTLSSNTAV